MYLNTMHIFEVSTTTNTIKLYKMGLELKHLAPYLPYGLKCTNSKESYLQTGEDRTGILEQLSIHDNDCVVMGKNGYFLLSVDEIVPILRPLSDLDLMSNKTLDLLDFFEPNEDGYGDDIIYADHLTMDGKTFKIRGMYFNPTQMPYDFVNCLLKLHYDVFGLIDQGLAIDINTLNK